MGQPRAEAMPTIKSVMTPFPYFVEIGDNLSVAQSMMTDHAIGHLPVCDGGKIVGVITDGNLQGRDPSELHVRDVYAKEVYVVELGEPLDRVLFRMAEDELDAALVVKAGKLAGIFTISDACRCFGEYLRLTFPAGDDDNAA